MNNEEYFLDIINNIDDLLESNTIISSQLLNAFGELKEYISNNKLGRWNEKLKGFDIYE